MRQLLQSLGWALISVIAVILAALVVASPAATHRAGCHTKHTCPSDHATYKWNGWWCVSPTADERTARYKKRVVYDHRVYFCRR